MSMPQELLPHGAYQSAQLGSWAAPRTRVPPRLATSVVVVGLASLVVDSEHAVATKATATTRMTVDGRRTLPCAVIGAVLPSLFAGTDPTAAGPGCGRPRQTLPCRGRPG